MRIAAFSNRRIGNPPFVPLRGNLLVVTVALILSMGGVAQARPPGDAPQSIELPDSPAGKILDEWFRITNAGEKDLATSFVGERFTVEFLSKLPADAMTAFHLQLHEQAGEFIPHKLLTTTDHELKVLAWGELGVWWEVTLVVEASPPHRIKGLRVVPAPESLIPAEADPAVAAATSEQDGKTYSDWKDLADLLGQARADLDLPALAAAWVEGGKIVEQAAVGVRQLGKSDPVRVEDLFHIGSITKSVTATMIGRLVEEGVIDWHDTIGTVLAEIEMRPEYRPVTLVELLAHRGRISPYTSFDDWGIERLNALTGSPTEERAAFVAGVLREEPLAPGMEYSNAGYVVAALMAERRAGATWEKLLEDKVFGPFGLSSAGIGWPATDQRPDQPRGHFQEVGGFRPQGLDEYPFGAFLAPAGNVHCSVADLARFGIAHLAGLKGRDGHLKSATIRRLHTPPDDGEKSYAGGWVVDEADDGAERHWHNGSAGTFYALVAIFPEDDTVFALTANAGVGPVEPVALKVLDALRAKPRPHLRWELPQSSPQDGS
ncbi:MAG: beta-lactamase family protein [bacterium]|nr:beta-lactamase family protein [bacterium]